MRRTDSHSYMIWGPTCDSTDLVASKACFPGVVLIGDWLVYANMGGKHGSACDLCWKRPLTMSVAYTSTTTTRFNGFPNDTQTVYI